MVSVTVLLDYRLVTSTGNILLLQKSHIRLFEYFACGPMIISSAVYTPDSKVIQFALTGLVVLAGPQTGLTGWLTRQAEKCLVRRLI